MLANLPVEIILLICEYSEFKDLGQLAWTNKRVMQIIKKHLPKALKRKTLFYLRHEHNGIVGLFNPFTCSVEEIAKFDNYYQSYEVATTQNKIFGINDSLGVKSFEIFDLNTQQLSEGPYPPERRNQAFVVYFRDKLYYLGGWGFKTWEDTNDVDILIDGKWQTGPKFPHKINEAQAITCDESLYVIGGWNSNKIYRLSADEREWIEVGEIPDQRIHSVVTSLNGRIYITGGRGSYAEALKSCLCFDPSAPVDSRMSRIADMNYFRWVHSLVVANEKLYAIGGFQDIFSGIFCNSIEEYDPQTNEWRKVGKMNIK